MEYRPENERHPTYAPTRNGQPSRLRAKTNDAQTPTRASESGTPKAG